MVNVFCAGAHLFLASKTPVFKEETRHTHVAAAAAADNITSHYTGVVTVSTLLKFTVHQFACSGMFYLYIYIALFQTPR